MLNLALRKVMFEVVRIPSSFNAVLIVLWGILGYTLDRIIRFDGLINFLIVTECSLPKCLYVKYLVSWYKVKKNEYLSVINCEQSNKLCKEFILIMNPVLKSGSKTHWTLNPVSNIPNHIN